MTLTQAHLETPVQISAACTACQEQYTSFCFVGQPINNETFKCLVGPGNYGNWQSFDMTFAGGCEIHGQGAECEAGQV